MYVLLVLYELLNKLILRARSTTIEAKDPIYTSIFFKNTIPLYPNDVILLRSCSITWSYRPLKCGR